MAKKHALDSAVTVYRIKPPEVWAQIRAGYEAGASFASLARIHDLGATTIRYRAEAHGWRRTVKGLEGLIGDAAPAVDALTIAEAALARSVEALAQGRAADAVALIKAGDAVGAFADFVRRLRAGAGEARAPDVAAEGSCESPARATP